MSIEEPASEPIGTTPVIPAVETPVTGPGRSRARWLVAGGVTLAVVAVAAAATLMLTGSSGTPDVLAWVPSDSVAYTELRLDLPGDQQAALAKTMSAFPGFADQAAFNTKLGEALDSLVHRATNSKQGYLADIAPWFGGQLSVSVGPIPTSADASAARGLLLASVKDATKAAAWANMTLSQTGATSTTETYAGITITIVTPPASAGTTMAGEKAAWASLGPVIALGDLASVKASIDTGGKKGLTTNAQFQTAAASITGDRLAFAYVDTASVAAGAKALAGSAAASAMPSIPAVFGDVQVPWVAMALRAQDGGFVVQTRMPHVAMLGAGGSGDAQLPSVVPADTALLVEGRTVGETLERLKTTLAADPSMADGVKQIDKTLALVGGFGGIVDWMGEVGVAVTRDGSTVSGGLVVVPSDSAAATRLLTQLKAAITLAGASSGSAGVKDETYKDATITTLDLSSLGPLVSGLAGGALGGSTGGVTPSIPANLFLSYAATDKVVVFGPDVAFIKAVLDARTGASLAGTDRFKAAIAATGAATGGLIWVDVSALRDLAETHIPSADQSAYTADFKPYLDAFDSVIGTFSPGSTIDSGTLDIRLRKP